MITDEDKRKLKAIYKMNKCQGKSKDRERLSPEEIEERINHIVAASTNNVRKRHLESTKTIGTENPECACDTRLKDDNVWKRKDLDELNAGYEWCRFCREIAVERFNDE